MCKERQKKEQHNNTTTNTQKRLCIINFNANNNDNNNFSNNNNNKVKRLARRILWKKRYNIMLGVLIEFWNFACIELANRESTSHTHSISISDLQCITKFRFTKYSIHISKSSQSLTHSNYNIDVLYLYTNWIQNTVRVRALYIANKYVYN